MARAPKLILGSMNFGDVVSDKDAEAIILRAQELGITEVDTANTYSGGRSEEIVGGVVKRHQLDLKISTKVGMPTGSHDKLLSEASVRAEVSRSLERMNIDSIDRLYLHQPDRTVAIQETLSAVKSLLEHEIINSLGLSNYSSWQSLEVLKICADWNNPIGIRGQQLYNLLARRVEDEYLEFAKNYNVSTVVYNPLAGGLLTDKAVESGPQKLSRYGSSRLASMYKDRYENAQTFEVIRELDALARENEMSLTELSFRWLVSKPHVDGILIGASSEEQLCQSVGYISQGSLPKPVIAECEHITGRLKGAMPSYNR